MTIEKVVQGHSCGIMVDTRFINRNMIQMCDIIRDRILRQWNSKIKDPHLEENKPTDEEAVYAILKDCIDHYLSMILSKTHVNNISFAYYIEERFAIIKDDLLIDHETMSYLETKFAEICGELGKCLTPAVDDLEYNGHAVENINSYAVDRYTSYYVVEGEDYAIEDQPDDSSLVSA